MKVLFPEKYGFCNGVREAIRKTAAAIDKAGSASLPCFVIGDVVHSSFGMEELGKRGLIRVDSPEEIKGPGTVVVRAHGITDMDRAILIEKGLEIVDATCPVVLHSQSLIRSNPEMTVVIGKAGHSEIVSLLGSGAAVLIEKPSDLKILQKGEYPAVVQTTFSVSVLDEIIRTAASMGISLKLLNSVCSASIDRRQALLRLAPDVEAFIIAGDRSSKNTVELYEVGKSTGKPSFLVSSPDEITSEILSFSVVGLTAGASCPDTLFQSIRRRLTNA